MTKTILAFMFLLAAHSVSAASYYQPPMSYQTLLYQNMNIQSQFRNSWKKVTPTPSNSPTPTATPTPTQPAQSASLYFGAYTGDNNDMTKLTQFETNAGKQLSISMWYQSWGVSDNSKNFQTIWMDNIRNHGAIPMVTWEPWNYTMGASQPTYSLSAIINGNHDAYIRKWAQDSKAWGKPYFLRLAHEMNGNWYPWSERVNGNTTGQYIQMWRHVHDIFTQEGVTNITWVWSVNIVDPTETPINTLYPGDQYVDWVAMDGYNGGTALNWGGWKSFTQVFQQTYNELGAITQKPLMVSETASAEAGGSKANWITNAYGSEVANMPKIKAIIWFNLNKETDWRITSSTTTKNAYRTAVAQPKYATNVYAGITSCPIQPL
jgi:beta-mannanase